MHGLDGISNAYLDLEMIALCAALTSHDLMLMVPDFLWVARTSTELLELAGSHGRPIAVLLASSFESFGGILQYQKNKPLRLREPLFAKLQKPT